VDGVAREHWFMLLARGWPAIDAHSGCFYFHSNGHGGTCDSGRGVLPSKNNGLIHLWLHAGFATVPVDRSEANYRLAGAVGFK